MNLHTDVVIVGAGVSGLYCALNLPQNKQILIISKGKLDESDSFLAQGGICVLKSDDDYETYFEDTMRAGHYENNKESVDIMIRSSRGVIKDLIKFGVEFERGKDGELLFTKEGAHSIPRILFHKDITGKEITSKLIEEVKRRKNIRIAENTAMVDIIEKDGECDGIVVKQPEGRLSAINADYTVFATGGIGGLFENSTNCRLLTGDALAISLKHDVELLHIDYIQIHPTTFYSTKVGRRFLISESVRGEGAILLNSKGERFVNELLPRDVVAAAIKEQMKKDKMPYVRLSLERVPKSEILNHFPNIYEYCLNEGYDITKEPIPVVPSQHYFMGGIKVNKYSKTSMDRLYAVGETACNGVHGKNRLASNSLLESLVFAKRAANDIEKNYMPTETEEIDAYKYADCDKDYKELVLDAIKKEKESHE